MKRALLGLALLAILPLSAQAADTNSGLSYTYIEGSYQNSDWYGKNFDGFGIAGSVSFGKDWYGSAAYRSVNNGDLDLDLDDSNINIGWHHMLSEKADFIAELGYVNYQADAGGGNNGSSDGYRLAIGLRGMLAPNFEAGIKASYLDVSDLESQYNVGVNAQYHINPTWGITASYDHISLLDEGMGTWGLGVRASF